MAIPTLHPVTRDAALALAAVEYTAERMDYIPSATRLFLNTIWTYGIYPPITKTSVPQDVIEYGWLEALYTPGMDYVLGEMRLRDEPDTALRWFHDGVYGASLTVFKSFYIAEYETLSEVLQGGCTSDVDETKPLKPENDTVTALGMALDDPDGFRAHFKAAQQRYETLTDETATVWPVLSRIPKDTALEWFE